MKHSIGILLLGILVAIGFVALSFAIAPSNNVEIEGYVKGTTFTFTDDDIPLYIDPKRMFGERQVEATVFYASETNLTNCRYEADPENRKGFSLVRVNNSNAISLVCGAKQIGEDVTITIEEGI